VVPGADCLFLFYIRRSWHSGKKRSGGNEIVYLPGVKERMRSPTWG
jgi:hypothetical protein